MYREADFLTSVCMSGVADLVGSPSDVGMLDRWPAGDGLVVKNIGLVGGDWNHGIFMIFYDFPSVGNGIIIPTDYIYIYIPYFSGG